MNKSIKVLIVVTIVSVLLSGCVESTVTPIAPEQQQTKTLKESQTEFLRNQPTKTLDWSLERENINKRTELWNDPNKVSYIYLISDNGVIMAFFAIKGKVTGLNSYNSPMDQIVEDPYVKHSTNGGYSGAGQVVDAPDELGTYGENNSGIFFFLTDGTYMEWTGMYLLADQPVKLTQQPVMIYEEE